MSTLDVNKTINLLKTLKCRSLDSIINTVHTFGQDISRDNLYWLYSQLEHDLQRYEFQQAVRKSLRNTRLNCKFALKIFLEEDTDSMLKYMSGADLNYADVMFLLTNNPDYEGEIWEILMGIIRSMNLHSESYLVYYDDPAERTRFVQIGARTSSEALDIFKRIWNLHLIGVQKDHGHA